MSEQSILKMFKEMQADIPQQTLNKWMHKVLKRMRDCLDGPLKNRLRQSTYTQNDETRLSVRSKDDKTGKYSYHTEYVHAMLSPEMKLVYMTYNEGSRSHKIQKEIIEGSNIHAITCDKFMTLLLKYRLNSHKYGATVMDAVNYILDDEVAFRRFLDDGHIEMHNIAAYPNFCFIPTFGGSYYKRLIA